MVSGTRCPYVSVSGCVMVMDVGDATSTTSMDVVKVGLENPVGLELGEI